MLSSFRDFVENYGDELFLVVVIVLVALVSFGLGRLSVGSSSTGELIIESTPIEIEKVLEALEQGPPSLKATERRGSVPDLTLIIGNKNSKIYHLPECSGAQRMLDKNKVFFASITLAKKAGYRPAENCPGLAQ